MCRTIPFNIRYIILTLSLFLPYFYITPVICLNNETDFQSFLAFKKSIVSDPQGALKTWNETLHFYSWQGILCSKSHPWRVVEIDLTSQGLVGPLTPHIGNISFLRYMILQNNAFSGPIPNEIGHLRRLGFVEFNNNSFSGEIPRNLSRCINVYWLNLVDNNLTGIIIPKLGLLLELECLLLSRNPLSGTIPPLIGNLTSLVSLYLDENEFESPSQLQSLLEVLALSGNNLTGRIPNALYNISTIDLFQVAYNQLHGTILSEIGSNFPRLTNLNLANNHFTGVIPTSLSNCSLLEIFDVDSNNFSKIMIDFSRLSALKMSKDLDLTNSVYCSRSSVW